MTDTHNKIEQNQQNFALATTAYQNAYVSNISGFQIVTELYKGMMGNIEQAKLAYQAGQLDKMCHLNEKTNRILIALQSHLDFDKGGDAAVFLNQFYNSIFASLAKILRKQQPEEEFDHIIAAIKPVYERWNKFSTDQSSQRK